MTGFPLPMIPPAPGVVEPRLFFEFVILPTLKQADISGEVPRPRIPAAVELLAVTFPALYKLWK